MSKDATLTLRADTLSAALGAVLAELGLPQKAKSRALNTLAMKIAGDGKTNWGGLRDRRHFIEEGLTLRGIEDALREPVAQSFALPFTKTSLGSTIELVGPTAISGTRLRFTKPCGESFEISPVGLLRSSKDWPGARDTLAELLRHEAGTEDEHRALVVAARTWLRAYKKHSRTVSALEDAVRSHEQDFRRQFPAYRGMPEAEGIGIVFDLMVSQAILSRDIEEIDNRIDFEGEDWIYEDIAQDRALQDFGLHCYWELVEARLSKAAPDLPAPCWKDCAPLPIIGWQIDLEDGSTWKDAPSFEVMTDYAEALEEHRAAVFQNRFYRLLEIRLDTIGEPHLV